MGRCTSRAGWGQSDWALAFSVSPMPLQILKQMVSEFNQQADKLNLMNGPGVSEGPSREEKMEPWDV
jgi:hypothetical protein